MKRYLLPALCAVLLVACDAGERIDKANDAVGAATDSPPPAPDVASADAAVPSESIAQAGSAPAEAPETVPVVIRSKPAHDLSPPVMEVVQLAQSTLGDTVVIHFIESIREPFTLNADQIIYLSDLGFGTPVLNALLTKAASSPGPGREEGAGGPPPVPVPAGANDPARIAGVPPPTPNPVPPNYLAPAGSNPLAGVPGGPGGPSGPVGGAAAPAYGPPPDGAGAADPGVAVAPGQPVTYDTFYSSLGSYGSWVEVEDQGWCWQPTVGLVNPGWQPYCDGGQWLWSDYGWYWHSNYSWGWAPFHYGRWHRAPLRGWVWTPGSDWGPAWVAWRHSDVHCGWAPLPPECHWRPGVGFAWYGRSGTVSIGFGLREECWFACPWGRFCDPVLAPHGLPRHEMASFVRGSRPIIAGDKSVNIVGNNNTVIINNGVTREQVQQHTHEEIRKVAVRDAAAPGIAARRVSTGSNVARPEVAVFRPHLAPETQQPSAPPSVILARQEARKTAGIPATDPLGTVPTRPNNNNVPSARPGASSGVGFIPGKNGNLSGISSGRSEIVPPAPAQSARPYPSAPPAVPLRGTANPAPNPIQPHYAAPASRQDPVAVNPLPTGRGEVRKFDVPARTPVYAPSGAAQEIAGVPPGSGNRFEAPNRPAPTYTAPAARPTPSFDSRRDVAPLPVVRPEPRYYAPPPASPPVNNRYSPPPVNSSPAPGPAPSSPSRGEPNRSTGPAHPQSR